MEASTNSPPPPPTPAACSRAYSPADIAANKAKVAPESTHANGSWGILKQKTYNSKGVGQALYDAAFLNDVATLQRLGDEWFANDVLNWPNPNDNGWTPLIKAVYEGHVECIKVLAALPGIDINKGNNNGSTSLHYATYYGHVECVRLLLGHPEIQVNKVGTSGGWKNKTPLSLLGEWKRAAEMDREEIRDMLRAKGGR